MASLLVSAPPAAAANLTLNPTTGSFGNIGVGDTSPPETFTLTNDTLANVNITDVSLSGSATHFTMTNNCGAALAPDNTCSIDVTFNPSSSGLKNAAIVITHDADPNPQTIPLAGTGVDGTLDPSPSSIDFGQHELAEAAVSRSITMENVAPIGDVTMYNPEITGDTGAFTIGANSCTFGLNLESNDDCDIEVLFDPATTGVKNATLRVNSTATNSPLDITLIGEGLADPVGAITFDPPSLDFGTKGVGSVTEKIVEITNSGGAPVNLAFLGLEGGEVGQFTLTDQSCVAGTLNPGGTCNATIAFNPTTAGTKSTELLLTTPGTPGTPWMLPVTGTAEAGTLSFDPASIDFGQAIAPGSPTTRVVELTNEGPGDVTLESHTLTGDAGQFAIAAGTCGPFPNTLSANESCTTTLNFVPLTPGEKDARYRVVGDASNSPLEIPLAGEGIAPDQPGISFDPMPVDFGKQAVNTPETKIVKVSNTGGAPLNLTGMNIVGGDPGFTQVNNCVISVLQPGGTCSVTVTYLPTTLGTHSSNLQVVSDAPGWPHLVTLTGEAAGPMLELTPTDHNFGGQALGTQSVAQLITATNVGDADMTFTAAPSTGGVDAAHFSLTGDTCGTSTLNPGESCAVLALFSPTSVGEKTGQVVFSSSIPGSPHTATLRGNGVLGKAGALDMTSVDFGTVAVGETSLPQTLVFTNTGTDDVTLGPVASIFGGDLGDFAFVSNGCFNGRVLTPGDVCSAIIEFTPTAEGQRTSAYSVESDAHGTPHVADLQGFGAAAKAPLIELSPASLDFGLVPEGTDSAAQLVTAKNVGTAPLSITAIGIDGPNAGQFSTSGDTCAGNTLAPGATCTLLARMSPTAPGILDGQITFATNAAGTPHTIHMTGIAGDPLAPIASFSVSDLDFGLQQINTTSAGKTIKLTNTGTADLILASAPAMGGVDAAEYSLTGDTCGTSSLAPGESCTLQALFSPTTEGPKVAQVEFASNAPGSVHAIPLAGIGADGKLAQLAPNLDFGSVPLGPKTATKQMTFTNTGSAPVTIGVGGATIVGGDAADYVMDTNGCTAGRVLDPGTNCVMDIYFDPAALGAKNAMVVVPSDAPGSPHVATLLGTAVQGKLLSVVPGSLSFGSEGVGSSTASQAVTLTNIGSEAVTLGAPAVELAGFNASDFQLDAGTCTDGKVMAPAESCQANVSFAPLAIGAKSATMKVNSDALGAAHTVTLGGTGVLGGLEFLPGEIIDFGDQGLGTTGVARLVKLKNSSPATITLDAANPLGLSGTNPGDFNISANSCGSSLILDPGEACALLIQFAPSDLGARSAVLEIPHDAAGGVSFLILQGNGVQGVVPLVQPGHLEFKEQGTDTQSDGRNVTITNVGTAAMLFNAAPSLTGVDAGEFQIAGDSCAVLPAMSLAPGGTCTVTITFNPTDVGQASAALLFDNNGLGAPQIVTLSGVGVIGPVEKFSDTGIQFGRVNVHENSPAERVTLKNVGKWPMKITGQPHLGGLNAGSFKLSGNTCGSGKILMPDAGCSVMVTFSPNTRGPKVATVRFPNDASGATHGVSLRGRGVRPKITFRPSDKVMEFGAVPLDGKETQRLVVINRGQGKMNIVTPPHLRGPDRENFDIRSNTCFVGRLSPQERCVMHIVFHPYQFAGKMTASVVFRTAGNPPRMHTITLRGRSYETDL